MKKKKKKIRMSEYETYLSDYNVVFNSIFTLNDISMNTSEIKPIHLTMPKKFQGLKASRPSHIRNETISPNPIGAQGQRLLSQRYLQKSTVSQPGGQAAKPQKILSDNAEKLTQSPHQQQESAQPVVKNENNEQQNSEHHKKHKKSINPSLSQEDNQAIIEILTRTGDYWLFPLSPSMGVRFKFSIENKPQRAAFLSLETNNKVLMHAKFDNDKNINIFFNDAQVAIATFSLEKGLFYAIVDEGNGNLHEACAASIDPKATNNQPRIFDFLIPALKKINGKSRMLQMKYEPPSALIKKSNQSAKECIKLKARIPFKNGNNYDMTFSGKFSKQSLSNIVLYHESNSRRDLCSLGLVDNDVYSLNIYYPLSPLQGFLAAILATIPF